MLSFTTSQQEVIERVAALQARQSQVDAAAATYRAGLEVSDSGLLLPIPHIDAVVLS